MFTGLVGGFWPGVSATALATVAADYWAIAPLHSLAVTSTADVIGLILFCLMGLFMSYVAHRNRRNKRDAEFLKIQAMRAAAIESSADAIIGESLDGTILSWNVGAERLFGYTAAEAVGRSVSLLMPESNFPALAEHLSELLTGKTIRGREVERLRQDGSRVHVAIVIAPVRDDAGRVIGVTKIAHDISDVKRIQEDLKAALRSAEAAQTAAQQANQAKDYFLAILSHELRTPLTPVLTLATMLKRDKHLPPEYRHDVEMILRNSQLEARLIDDLLDVTRIVRGKLELDLRATPLCQIIHGAVEICTPDIEARRIHFGVDIGPDAPYVIRADSARLQQVFWNLIRNSIKFTPQGGCIGIRCRANSHGSVIAEVTDSGQGIDPGLLPHIFNAFEQGGRQTTRKFGGMGLGLTICKGVVEQHGGKIEAHSDGQGKGATFRITLPLLVNAAAEQPPGDRPTASNRSTTTPRQAILLVEDHGDTAKIMVRLLHMNGHHVETAGDVATALKLASSRRFHLLISDLGLPDGSGVDLIRALRQQGHEMPAIAISGYGQEQDIQFTSAAGFAAHLTKPVDVDHLYDTIAALAAAQIQVAGVTHPRL